MSFLLLRRRRVTQLAGATLLLGVVMQAQATQRIEFSPDPAGAYPEGIAWEPRAGAFLISSLRGGQLGLVYPDGRYRRFSTDKGLITTSGMLVDTERNRVLVCNEDVGVSSIQPLARAIAWRRCWSSISIPARCSRRTISHR
ncbi:hypothetical protein [Serratia bockelmannii]|uniref:hypothetical protein n=1 Tax=Serratia bockelmannii TaxID=2703793 RepID=UPI003F6BCF9A